MRIEQVICVQRPSQRAIVLGEGGQRIKTIGARARAELEHMLERRVHLFLFVKGARELDRGPRALCRRSGSTTTSDGSGRTLGLCWRLRRHGENAVIVELLTQRAWAACRLGPRRAVAQVAGDAAARQRGRGAYGAGASTEHLGHASAASWCGRMPRGCSTIPARLAGLTSAAALVACRFARARAASGRLRFVRAPDRSPRSGDRLAGALCRGGSGTCSARSGSVSTSARCAVSGATTDLAYVSPRTGRAVSRAAGLPYQR